VWGFVGLGALYFCGLHVCISCLFKASNKLPTLFFVQKQQSTSFNLFISTKQQKNLPSIIVLHLRQQDTAAINLALAHLLLLNKQFNGLSAFAVLLNLQINSGSVLLP
jgi:dipeptide/tripeptide permease